MNVESIKTELVKIIGNVTYVHAIIENVSDKLRKSELEIDNLNSIIDELRDENERLIGELAKRSKHSAERVELETN